MMKRITQRLMMLAVTVMASMACFAQGNAKIATGGPGPGLTKDQTFGYMGVLYKLTENPSEGLKLYKVVAVGFEQGLLDDISLMTSDLEGEIAIQHFVPASGSTYAFLVQGVVDSNETYAFKNVSTDLAKKIKELTIDYKGGNQTVIDNNGTAGVVLPTTGSIFAKMTSLTNVKNLTPGNKIASISINTFSDVTYNTAELLIPSGDETMRAYASKTGWSKFIYLTNGADILGDLDGSGEIDIDDLDIFLDLIYEDPEYLLGDLDGSGEIDIDDLDILLDKIFGY